MSDLMQLVKDIGPYASVILFFVWRDYKREQLQVLAISAKDAQIIDVTNKLTALTAKYESALDKVVSAVNRNSDAVARLMDNCDKCNPQPHPESKRPSTSHISPADLETTALLSKEK